MDSLALRFGFQQKGSIPEDCYLSVCIYVLRVVRIARYWGNIRTPTVSKMLA